ncbi:hypothetical protein Ccrd_026457 [Cynara cardunculus var. scolymus]|uniref:Myosin motor domain-containing protein n=1 Tax=Cynara cardunculus var. scolymus TaxID=59895 RepID=A0A103XD69_CYNCS|nr:hypothetical protein Ccrd_026457 [Cynara cardunculus var. scolymus]
MVKFLPILLLSTIKTSNSAPRRLFSSLKLVRSKLAFLQSYNFAQMDDFRLQIHGSQDDCPELKEHLKSNPCFRGERGNAFTVHHYAGEIFASNMRSQPEKLVASSLNISGGVDSQKLSVMSKFKVASLKTIFL